MDGNDFFRRGNCRRNSVGLHCETGLRRRTYHVLSGSVLSVWTKVESVLASIPGGIASRMQIIRLRTEDGKKIVGKFILKTIADTGYLTFCYYLFAFEYIL